MASDCLLLSLPQGLDRVRIDGWTAQYFDLGEGEEQGYHRSLEPRGAWHEVPQLDTRGRRGRDSIWYRAVFPRPAWAERTLLRFDGACVAANVWINGKLLGSHYGYPGPFGFDVSSYLEDRNVVAVCVQAAEGAHLAPALAGLQDDEGPYWPLGLNGRVWLERVGNAVVESLAARWEVSPGRAEAQITTSVRNLDAREMEFTLGWALLPPEPADGEAAVARPPVARWRRNIRLGSRESGQFETRLAVDRPDLWWPWTLGDQPMYTLVAQVDADSRSTTALREVGIRDIELTPGPGFVAWVVNQRRHFPRGAVLPPLMPGDADPLGAWRLAGLDLALAVGQLPSPQLAAAADAAGVLLVVDPPVATTAPPEVLDHQAEALALVAPHPSAAVMVERGVTIVDGPSARAAADELYTLVPVERARIESARRAKYHPYSGIVLRDLPDLAAAEGTLAPTAALLEAVAGPDDSGRRVRVHVVNDDVSRSGTARVHWTARPAERGGWRPRTRERSGHLDVRLPAPDEPALVYDTDAVLPVDGGMSVELELEQDGEQLSYIEYDLDLED